MRLNRRASVKPAETRFNSASRKLDGVDRGYSPSLTDQFEIRHDHRTRPTTSDVAVRFSRNDVKTLPKQSFEIFWQLCSASVTRVHRDENTHRWVKFDLCIHEIEQLPFRSYGVLETVVRCLFSRTRPKPRVLRRSVSLEQRQPKGQPRIFD